METSLALVKKGAKEVVALFLLCSPSFFFLSSFSAFGVSTQESSWSPRDVAALHGWQQGAPALRWAIATPRLNLFTYIATLCAVPAGELLCM